LFARARGSHQLRGWNCLSYHEAGLPVHDLGVAAQIGSFRTE